MDRRSLGRKTLARKRLDEGSFCELPGTELSRKTNGWHRTTAEPIL